MPHELIFVFIRYFTGAILPKKCVVKSGGLGKKDKKGDGHIGGVVYRRGGFKPSAYYGLLDFEQVFVQWERSDRNPGQS